jgi:hypothetical protein
MGRSTEKSSKTEIPEEFVITPGNCADCLPWPRPMALPSRNLSWELHGEAPNRRRARRKRRLTLGPGNNSSQIDKTQLAISLKLYTNCKPKFQENSAGFLLCLSPPEIPASAKLKAYSPKPITPANSFPRDRQVACSAKKLLPALLRD